MDMFDTLIEHAIGQITYYRDRIATAASGDLPELHTRITYFEGRLSGLRQAKLAFEPVAGYDPPTGPRDWS